MYWSARRHAPILTGERFRLKMPRMQINLNSIVKNVYDQPMKRAESFVQPGEQPNMIDMTLGYLVVETLPKALEGKASEEETLRLGRLQRRAAKGGSVDFTAEEIALMKKGVLKALREGELDGVAAYAIDLLENKIEA